MTNEHKSKYTPGLFRSPISTLLDNVYSYIFCKDENPSVQIHPHKINNSANAKVTFNDIKKTFDKDLQQQAALVNKMNRLSNVLILSTLTTKQRARLFEVKEYFQNNSTQEKNDKPTQQHRIK